MEGPPGAPPPASGPSRAASAGRCRACSSIASDPPGWPPAITDIYRRDQTGVGGVEWGVHCVVLAAPPPPTRPCRLGAAPSATRGRAPTSPSTSRRGRGLGTRGYVGVRCVRSAMRNGVNEIRAVLGASPSCGEGYRKVRARLARQHSIHAAISEGCAWSDGAGCPAAGSSSGGARAGRDDHPRRIEPALGFGRDDGLDVATTAACGCSVAWITYPVGAWAHVAKLGDRHAAQQPLYDAVIDRWAVGATSMLTAPAGSGCVTGSSSQYRSSHYQGSLLAGHRRRPHLRRRARSQRLRRTMDLNPHRPSAFAPSSTTPSIGSAKPSASS